MTTATKADAINGAMSIAEDIASGELDPADLERQAITELTALMDVEPDPGSPLAELMADVCRRALARGALPANEIREFAAVVAAREAAASGGTATVPADEFVAASGDYSADSDDDTDDDDGRNRDTDP